MITDFLVDEICCFSAFFIIFFGFYVRNICKTFAFYRGVYLSHRLRLDVNWKAVKNGWKFFSAQKIQTFCALKKVTSESQIFFAFYRGFLPLTIDSLLWIGKSQNNGWNFFQFPLRKSCLFVEKKRLLRVSVLWLPVFFLVDFYLTFYHKTENKVWHFSGRNWCSSLSKPLCTSRWLRMHSYWKFLLLSRVNSSYDLIHF